MFFVDCCTLLAFSLGITCVEFAHYVCFCTNGLHIPFILFAYLSYICWAGGSYNSFVVFVVFVHDL